MNIKHLIEERVGVLDTAEIPTESEEKIEEIINLDYDVLVTFAEHDFSLSWKVGDDPFLRHYSCALGSYPIPSQWELQHFNEYILYELYHDRKVALWFKDETTKQKVIASILDFFQTKNSKLEEVIQTKLAAQKSRAKKIPDKLTHCTACIENGCRTDYVCHTTSVESALDIIKTGEIYSACKARNANPETLARDRGNVAGDPPDYFEYVMFSFGNCQAGDRLVTERRLGRFPEEEDLHENFRPGVRFYFKYDDLIEHPDFISDGYHYVKIKDSIALEPDLVALAASKEVKSTLLATAPSKMQELFIFLDHSQHDIWTWSHNVYEEIKELK